MKMTHSRAFIALRAFAEQCSRAVVLKRRMPAQFGGDRIFVSPGALLKLWWPNIEFADKSLFNWASEFISEGNVVWDIGANVGLFTFAAASLAGASGHVLAVEADTWLVNLLRKSAQRCAHQRAMVEILPVAASSTVGIARFNIAQRGRAANYLDIAQGSSQTGGVRETQSVMTVTLDWLLEHFPAPDVVKIDVEGAEDLVLRGSKKLLSEVRPKILCEVRHSNARSVSDLFHSFHYELYDLHTARMRQLLEMATFNTLACPSGV